MSRYCKECPDKPRCSAEGECLIELGMLKPKAINTQTTAEEIADAAWNAVQTARSRGSSALVARKEHDKAVLEILQRYAAQDSALRDECRKVLRNVKQVLDVEVGFQEFGKWGMKMRRTLKSVTQLLEKL
jgi:hypothetical protein